MSISISNPDIFRENIKNKLSKIIEDDTIATNVEKSIFNFTINESKLKKLVRKWESKEFVALYMDRLRSIYINLKNPNFLAQIKNKEITPQQLSKMTHQEFNPEHWKELIERKIKRDSSKYVMNIEASTDMYTCKKCKSKKCHYFEMQTRSADEPTTIFVTCLDCGKQWKT
jgi:transcription elongation factor S-II